MTAHPRNQYTYYKNCRAYKPSYHKNDVFSKLAEEALVEKVENF